MKKQTTNDAETVRQQVRDGYGQIARTGGSCCGPACGCSGEQLAQQIGYTADDLIALPEGANMGLSCGNPTAIAALRPGEVVVDLGSGGGFDVFIAARKIGPTGRAIGVDMTPDMIAKARRNIPASGLNNVEFRLGEIEHLPVADASADVIISNCVINLSPDKPQVWRELARVLRPGGRVVVSDIALLKPLPAAVSELVASLVGCVAGAVLAEETGRMARDAGLVDIELKPKPGYVEAMADSKDPLYRQILEKLPAGQRLAEYVTSLEIAARKPESP